MYRLLTSLVLSITFGLSFPVVAQQSSGGGNGGLKDTCEISGGQWTGSESGNWACCWADWGCYGCVDGNCKIKCTTERCRKANSVRTLGADLIIIKGLAPAGMKAPIIPKKPKAAIKNPNSLQKTR